MENLVTQKMIESIKWWNYEEIKTKVQQEYDAWHEVAMKKRPILAQYIRDYNVEWDDMKDWETLRSKSLYTNRNLFISALYKNRPLVTFEWRKQWDSEYADTWNNLLKFDYDELDEDVMTYKKISNIVDYWIYLAVDEWWDKVTESPRKRLYSPLCWIPDPYFDMVKWFAFHWFELILTEWEINELYQNTDYMLTDSELKKIRFDILFNINKKLI